MKTYIICAFIFLLLSDDACRSRAQVSEDNRKPRSLDGRLQKMSEMPDVSYEIIMSNCEPSESCIVIAYCDPIFFNESDMKHISESISRDFKDSSVVNLSLFDKKELAESYAKGTRNLGALQQERRGWYFRQGNKEFLLFYPDSNRRSKPISVRPQDN